MCGCECCISDKSIHYSLLSWRDWYLKNSKIKYKMLKIEGPVKNKICIYETYKNTVMPHRRRIYGKAFYIKKATMFAYPQSDHAFPHWKCVFKCCAKCPCVSLPDQETYYQYSNTTLSVLFRIYRLISCCAAHGRLPLNDKANCHMCKQE